MAELHPASRVLAGTFVRNGFYSLARGLTFSRPLARLRIPRGLRKDPANLASYDQCVCRAIQFDGIPLYHRLPLPQSSFSRVHRVTARGIRNEMIGRNVRRL